MHRGQNWCDDGYRARINQFRNAQRTHQAVRHRSCSSGSQGYPTLDQGDPNAAAREIYAMNPVALLTPTYGRDLELCTLLCESVDRHVKSFSKHYLLVPDCDLPLFAHLASERRIVIPASTYMPGWL